MPRRHSARPAPSWVGDLSVVETTLANGLAVLVLPRTHVPIVVCDLFFPVGSADEPPGQCGVAHFVEHMLFKGTERYPKGEIDRLATTAGGQANAETSEDSTHYWFALPTRDWETALAIEADRITHAAFDPEEVELERRVIVEERARDLDSPFGRLDQTHLAISFLTHPYRNPVLGWPEDLKSLTAQDLRAFHAEHYRPDGAVLVIVGDVDPAQALDRVEAHLGAIPRGRTPRRPSPPPEPAQCGRREFLLRDAESAVRGLFGWRSVSRTHPDGPALDVLADLLACGKRSRLQDRLVERDRRATWVDATHEPSRLDGQFLVQLELPPSLDSRRDAEAALFEEIERIARLGPTPDELLRVRRRLEAGWRWEQEDLSGLASALGQSALWGHWRDWQDEFRRALAVDESEVRRVARLYLDPDRLTVGWSVPAEGDSSPASSTKSDRHREPAPFSRARESSEPIPSAKPRLRVASAQPTLLFQPRREVLPNGLRLVSERRPGTGTIALELFVDAGMLREAKPGLAALAARLLEESQDPSPAEILEDLGGTFELASTGASVRVRSEDLATAVDLLARIVTRPHWDADDLAWVKRKTLAELRADRDDPAFRAEMIFRQGVYGSHPYAHDPRGRPKDLSRIDLLDIADHHSRFFRADNACLAVAGDFDPRRLKSLVGRAFGPWEGHFGGFDVPIPAPDPKSKLRRVRVPGEQVYLTLGHLGIRRTDPDFDALVVVDHLLGSGPGFTDRLNRVLRDEMGLAYAVSGGMTDSADIEPGTLRIALGTSPDQVERALKATVEQLRIVRDGGFSDEDVEQARRFLVQSWAFDLQTVGQRADRLLELERFGLPLNEPLRWPERIARLEPEQVRLAARRHLRPDALMRVIYGPLAET